MAPQFDFGQNWKEFAATALTSERVQEARRDFAGLMQDIPLAGKRFLDVGFGQGLALLLAMEAQALCTGCDINPKCGEALDRTRRFFPALGGVETPVVIGSILDGRVVTELRARGNADGTYDIVHSWGVLHHTGDMVGAIRNAASLVAAGGYLVIAIYNRHWSSVPWLCIKWLYSRSPAWLQRLLVRVLYPVIWLAKLTVTGYDPKKMERGMDFYYNVIDWVGGYPYEYGSVDEVRTLVELQGFQCVRVVPAKVPTGCNEFVFKRPLPS